MRKLLGRLLESSPPATAMAVACDNFLRGTRVRVRGQNNRLLLGGSRLVRVRFNVEGDGNEIEIGSGSRLFDCVISVRGDGHRIRIGRDCILGKMTIEMQSEGTAVVIGERTTSGGVVLDLNERGRSITIGDDCMISFAVEMRCGDSHSVIDRQTGNRLNPAKDILIGNHVWLGAYSAILKGATIGRDSVVGFRSTVTGAVEECSLVVGTPARVIRKGVSWDRELL